MPTPTPHPLTDLRPEELELTLGGRAAPLAPPPIICYWPRDRLDLRVTTARAAVSRGSPRR